MKFRTTVILMALVAAALVFVIVDRYWGSNETKPPTKTDKQSGRKLVDINRDSVKRLVIRSNENGTTIELAKDGGKWSLKQPIAWAADSFAADGLLDNVLSLRARGGVELTGENRSAAGLDKPRYTIEVDGAQPIKVAQDGTLKRWRKKAGEHFDKNDTLVEIEQNGEITKITAEAPGKLDKRSIEEGQKVGSATTVGEITYDTVKLQIGNQHELSNDLYVASGDGKEAWLASASGLTSRLDESTDKLVSSIRDAKLVRDSTWDVKQVKLTHEGQTLAFAKIDGTWRITAPESLGADSERMSDLLNMLTGLRAESFIADNSPEAKRAGVDKPQVTVWMSTVAPSTQPAATQPAGVTLTFGQFDNIEKKKVYVRASDPSVLAKVNTPAGVLDFQTLANASIVDFRDRKVLDIDPLTVSKLAIVVDQKATTQPTSRPAKHEETLLERRKQTLELGPALPPMPVTKPATLPTTGVAATGPATTQAVAVMPPATPASTWELKGTPGGDADDSKVTTLLEALHPLKVKKYLDPKAPATQPVADYTLTINTEAAGGAGSATHVIRLMDPGADKPLEGSYNNLRFEIDRDFATKLEGGWSKSSRGTGGAPVMP